MVANVKTYYKATAIKAVWYWLKSSYLDQWNRRKSPEIDSNKYSLLIFNKAKRQFNGERKIFLSMDGAVTIGKKHEDLIHTHKFETYHRLT